MWDGAPNALPGVRTNGSGSFCKNVQVPQSSVGGHTVSANLSGVAGSATFSVTSGSAQPTSTPTASPTSTAVPTATSSPVATTTPTSTPTPTPSASPPTTLQRKGVNVDIGADQAKNTALFQLAQQAGSNVFRSTLGWRDYEPSVKGTIDPWALATLDQIVTSAEQNGLAPILGIARPPCWASGDPQKNCATGTYNQWYPPANPADYGDFMRVLVNRYGSRVLAWEVWNEPNMDYFWGYAPKDAARYVSLVKAARNANPNAFILGGAIANTDVPYITQMYDAGLKGYMDALSIHPYVWMDPAPGGAPEDCSYLPMSLKCGVPQVRSVMQGRGDNVPMWFTEFGWTTGWVSEAVQADYLKRAFQVIAGFPYVPVAIWYTDIDRRFIDPTFPLTDRECCFGLYRADKSAKPAVAEFRNVPLR